MTVIEYHRPKELKEALELLARKAPPTVPLAGGSALNRPSEQPVAVVDLQGLGLNSVERQGGSLVMGATLTLQALQEVPDLPKALGQAIQQEAAYNLRQVATVAGTLVAAGGSSPFATLLLALDARLTWVTTGIAEEPAAQVEQIGLGELLPLRTERLPGHLITQVSVPLNTRAAYASVARTPADRPVVCAAAAIWPSGRTRIALGGYGRQPLLAMDGPDQAGLEAAVHSAFHGAGDEWASAEYRQEAAVVLARRCLAEAV